MLPKISKLIRIGKRIFMQKNIFGKNEDIYRRKFFYILNQFWKSDFKVILKTKTNFVKISKIFSFSQKNFFGKNNCIKISPLLQFIVLKNDNQFFKFWKTGKRTWKKFLIWYQNEKLKKLWNFHISQICNIFYNK